MAAVLSVVAAGCTVGPDFKAPTPPPTTRYISSSESTPAAVEASASPQKIALGERVAADWWKLFRSSDLTSLVKLAITGSPTLESAKARLAEAREAVTAASGALYPQVSFDASVARQKVGAATFGLTQSQAPLPPNFNVFQVGPTVGYELKTIRFRRGELLIAGPSPRRPRMSISKARTRTRLRTVFSEYAET
jgi:outer membrane protein TolC